MKLIPCPLNGPRPENEFITGGAARAMPAAEADDAAWSDYLFMDDNAAGEVWEWWCHTPSAFWFAAKRDTVRDEIIETMTVGEAVKRLGV